MMGKTLEVGLSDRCGGRVTTRCQEGAFMERLRAMYSARSIV